MKQKPVLRSPRAVLFIGAALLSTPALAQEEGQATSQPPPVVQTAPPPVITPVYTPQAETPAPAPAPSPTVVFAPESPTVQQVPVATPEPAANPAPVTHPAARTTHDTARTQAPARPAPVQSAPEPAAPAPVAEPQPAQPEVAPAPAPEAATQPAAPARSPAPVLPWVILAMLVLAGGILVSLLRRRAGMAKTTDETAVATPPRVEPLASASPRQVEPVIPVQAEPIAAVAPVAAPAMIAPAAEPATEAPSAAPVEVEAHAHEAASDDLAAFAAGSAPTDAHRPWIEIGMRPVRAGTTDEEASVEIELTIGNTGDVDAKEVHVRTFMLADAEGSEMERELLRHARDADSVPPVTIAPGEGTRVDATLATPKDGIGRTFNPVVIADARYRLPDGKEGRTTAAFRIGRPAEQGIGPIGATRPHFVDDVEAELDRVLQRA